MFYGRANAHALLSGGQKSRVAFADLSLSNPDVIVLVGIVPLIDRLIHKLGAGELYFATFSAEYAIHKNIHLNSLNTTGSTLTFGLHAFV